MIRPVSSILGAVVSAFLLGAAPARAQAEADKGAAAPAASTPAPEPVAPPAPAPAPPPAPAPTLGYDVVQTPWGPGRKSSGELFRSSAVSLGEGPLRWKWNDFSFAVGGQYFARGEVRDSEDFNAAAGDHTLGVDHRARFSFRGSAKERVGLVLEFQDVRGWGSETNTTTVMPNTGLHQGYVDLKATSFLDVRIGRQELSYGEDRLIGNLDWAQAARAFDGVFARVTPVKEITIDAFGMMLKPPAWLTPDAAVGGPKYHNSGSYFTGLYGRARFGKMGADLYFLGLMEDGATALTGSRKDNNRFTLGARAFANISSLALVGEGAYQFGSQGQNQDAVSAGAFAAKATYTLSSVFGNPYIMGEFSGATGDGDATDGKENTFNQLFPTAHTHLGYMDYVAWQNVIAGHGAIGIRPWGSHFWVDVHYFTMWNPKGAWYRASGAVFLAADAMRTAGAMGTEIDLNFTIPVFANVALAGNFSMFLPGKAAESKGTGMSTWGFLYVRSQF